MSLNNKIKVVGYAKRDFFNNNIEYRNFSPGLVGLQQTSLDESSLFTLGNFVITTSEFDRGVFVHNKKPFGDFITLDNLTENNENLNAVLNSQNSKLKVTLNTDNSELCNFAYFGSSMEFIRVSLENIIKNWSLYEDSKHN